MLHWRFMPVESNAERQFLEVKRMNGELIVYLIGWETHS